MARESAPKKTDALREALPICEVNELVYANRRNPEVILVSEEQRTIFETLAPELLSPVEYQIFVAMLNRESSRRDLAKELGMTVQDVLRIEEKALGIIKTCLPEAIKEHQAKILMERKSRPPRFFN